MIRANELRIGNLVRYADRLFTVIGLEEDLISIGGIDSGHLNGTYSDGVKPIPITAERLERLGFVERSVCATCAKISTSELCYKGSGSQGDHQFREQAMTNGKWVDCKEKKKPPGHYYLRGFDIFQGKTIQHWSREGAWNFSNLSWNLNLTIDYVHQLQNLYFALTGEELLLNVSRENAHLLAGK